MLKSHKMNLNNIVYSININEITNKRLNNQNSKITLGLIIKAFRKSNMSILKDGINALIINSDKFTNIVNTVLFNFETKTSTINLFKIANKYIPNKNILTFQFIDDIDIQSYKNKLYERRMKKEKEIQFNKASINNKGLMIVKKVSSGI